jgi:hypothetical protein
VSRRSSPPATANIAADHPRVTKAWADTGYRTTVVEHDATLGIDVEVTRRDPAQKGFKVIPRRWASSGPSAGSCTTAASPATTRPAPTAPKAMIQVAMVDLIGRRLARESTLNWRDS